MIFGNAWNVNGVFWFDFQYNEDVTECQIEKSIEH